MSGNKNSGRQAMPIEQKIMRGHAKDRMPDLTKVPLRVDGTPVPPDFLGPAELECWEQLVDILAQRGQLSVDSYWSLVAICTCYAEWRELREDIKENGRTYWVTTISGDSMERARPQVAMFQECDRRFKTWLNEFGLTDASRHKVQATPPDKDKAENPLERWNLS